MEDSTSYPNVPLLHLVAGGDQPTVLDVAKRLLTDGVDANLTEPDDGLTPLHVAAHWDRLAMVQLLLLHGADPQRPDAHGRTPMSMARGDTKKFLERMARRTDSQRRSVLRRVADLHFGSRISKVLKGARKRVRRTIGSLWSLRARAYSDNQRPVVTSTPRVSFGDSSAATGGTSYITALEELHISRRQSRGGPAAWVGPAPVVRGTNGDVATARASLYPLLRQAVPITPENRPRKENKRATPLHNNVTMRVKKTPAKKTGGKKGRGRKVADDNSDWEWIPSQDEEEEAPCLVTPSQRHHQRSRSLDAGRTLDEGSRGGAKASARGRSQSPAGALDGSGRKGRSKSRCRSGRQTPDGLRDRVAGLTETKLRKELKSVGIAAGPMSGGVRTAYERKLVDIHKAAADLDKGGAGGKGAPKNTSVGARFSRPLELAMAGRGWHEGSAVAADESLRAMFVNRGVTAFCYLLLDPRLLPAKAEDVTLAMFVEAIFYIGKGTKARPLQHLIDAKRENECQSPRLTSKLSRIIEIWRSNTGVLSVQISQNICDEEALTREAALIECMGIRNLTNVQSGKYYATTSAWSPLTKAQLGTLMLKRARHVLLAEGLRPIRPEALPDTLFRPHPSQARGSPKTPKIAPIPTPLRRAIPSAPPLGS